MMRRFVAVVLALVGIMAACGASNPAPGSDECSTYHRTIDFVADATFTDEERAAIDGAAEDWRVWSDGRVRLSVTYGVPVGSPARIVRTTSDQDPIAATRLERQQRFNAPWYVVAALTTNGHIYMAMDRIPLDVMRGIAAHEMGHAAGLKWPDCENEPHAATFPDGSKDCAHVSTPGALMAAAWADKTAWSDADKELCQASCLCD